VHVVGTHWSNRTRIFGKTLVLSTAWQERQYGNIVQGSVRMSIVSCSHQYVLNHVQKLQKIIRNSGNLHINQQTWKIRKQILHKFLNYYTLQINTNLRRGYSDARSHCWPALHSSTKQNRTVGTAVLSLPIRKQTDKTNHAQHLPAKGLATDTNRFTFNFTNYNTMSYRWISDFRLMRQFAFFWDVTPRTFKQSFKLINRAGKGKGHPITGPRSPRGGGWSAPRPGRFTPVPIVQQAGWVPGPVWTRAKNLARTGIRSPDRPALRQSLQRLSYPGP
jgi:hypothetical protein